MAGAESDMVVGDFSPRPLGCLSIPYGVTWVGCMILAIISLGAREQSPEIGGICMATGSGSGSALIERLPTILRPEDASRVEIIHRRRSEFFDICGLCQAR